MANLLLERAAHQRPARRRGAPWSAFLPLCFRGLSITRSGKTPAWIWRRCSLSRITALITIASGGCNILNYLAHAPVEIVALDLNPNHVALTRLKLAALAHLPDHESFFRFFGEAKAAANVEAFDRMSGAAAGPETRAYWQKKVGPRKRRRIEMFARGLYHHGLMGRFIGMLHVRGAAARQKAGRNAGRRKTPREQRAAFDTPDRAFVRFRGGETDFQIAHLALRPGDSAGPI